MASFPLPLLSRTGNAIRRSNTFSFFLLQVSDVLDSGLHFSHRGRIPGKDRLLGVQSVSDSGRAREDFNFTSCPPPPPPPQQGSSTNSISHPASSLPS